jgi:4-amino-4-deoxy-L-arabinose transferase-like glycosyltransferase
MQNVYASRLNSGAAASEPRGIAVGRTSGWAWTTAFVLAAAIVLRWQALLPSSVDWDEGVYLIMAQRWLAGGLPYVAVWDQHPPGLPALLALAQAVIDDPVAGARLATTLAVALTGLFIHRLCLRATGDARAGLVGALLYVVCVSRWFGLAANPVTFDNACVTAAAYLLYSAATRPAGRLIRAGAAALLLGLGLQIKYVVFPEATALCLGYLVMCHRQGHAPRDLLVAAATMILAGCLPTAAAVAYFWANGALAPFLGANIGSNLRYLTILPDPGAAAKACVSGLGPVLGAIAVIVYARASGGRRERLAEASLSGWILLWTLAALADVAMALKFFVHYYLALYPPICLAAALAFSRLAARGRVLAAASLGVLFAAALPFWAIGVARAMRATAADAPREVADFITRSAAPDSDVFVFDYAPVVYALARLRPRTPYVLGGELTAFSHSSNTDGPAEITRLMDLWPDFIVLRLPRPAEPGAAALNAIVAARLPAYRCLAEFPDGADNARVRVYGAAAPWGRDGAPPPADPPAGCADVGGAAR